MPIRPIEDIVLKDEERNCWIDVLQESVSKEKNKRELRCSSGLL
jgi:gluconate kinase